MTSNKQIAYILIGRTGLGKSSLVCINCPDVDNKIIGHGVKSKTSGFHLYDQNANTIWVDTMGTNDYEGNINDEDILRHVMFGLNKKFKYGVNIKVLWFVPKSDRCEGDMKTQAKFIKSISGNDRQNIWNSTAIIIKNAYLEPKRKAFAPLHAAYLYGAPISSKRDKHGNTLGNVSTMGYTIIEELDSDDDEYEECKEQGREKRGYLYKKEIKQLVSSKLNKLPFFTRKFTNSKCTKCGVVGDEDFVPLKCHTNMTKIHPSNDKKHTGERIYKHRNTDSTFHDGHEIKYHPLGTHFVKNGSKTYVKRTERLCGNGHTGLERKIVREGSFNCKHGETIYEGEYQYHCFTCAPNNFNYTRDGYSGTWKGAKWCEQHTQTRDIYGNKTLYKNVWECCHWDVDTKGCKSKMSCCDKEIGSKGCKYSCCNNDVDSNGCTEYWSCCGTKTDENKPCAWSCCESSILTADPCKKICQNCRRDWGTEGCGTENRSHNMKRI